MRKNFEHHRFTRAALLILFSAAIASGETAATTAGTAYPPRTWTVGVQAGVTNTFQMVLGGAFGKGPDLQNRLSLSLNNALRRGDQLSVFGWHTTDLPAMLPNYQFGVTYKSQLVKKGKHLLTGTAGIQRWVLPIVKTGALDWHVTGNLTYSTVLRGVSLTVSEDSWTLLRSTLPTGSGLYSQINAQHKLWSTDQFQLSLRHGPAYMYSWGLYGAWGHRVFRYQGLLVGAYKGFTVEGGARQQFGLQDRIPRMRYWSLMVSRQFTGNFHH